jgi:hypothetical protein
MTKEGMGKMVATAGRAADKSAMLPKTSADPGVVVTTCSWAESNNDGLHLDRFLRGLRSASQVEADLILAAGFSQDRAIEPKTLLGASGGIPVLYESKERGRFVWRVCWRRSAFRQRIVRDGQTVVREFDRRRHPERHHRLRAGLVAEHGVLRFDGIGFPLILFICGENNALSSGYSRSVLVVPGKEVPAVLCEPWAALNPAHAPYTKTGSGSALVKIERIANGNGPIFPRTVNRSGAYNDGTLAPFALLHCNNFRSSDDEVGKRTRRNSSALFEQSNQHRSARLSGSSQRAGVEFIHSSWSIRLP